MKLKFTTLASVLLACTVGANAINIDVTVTDVLHEVIDNASEGDVLILADGTYAVVEEGVVKKHTVNLVKSITIKAANQGKAKLAGYYFAVPADETVASFVVDGVEAVGHDATTGDYFLQVNTATSVMTTLELKNSRFADFGRGVVRGTTEGAKMTNILIGNCIFTNNSLRDASYNTINPQKATCESIIIKNSTFYNQPAGILRAESSKALNLLIQNCTVLNCGSAPSSQNMISAKGLVAGSKVEKSIFSGAYVAAEELLDKAINLNNAENGTVDGCLLEGYSGKLVEGVMTPVLTKGATVTNPVEATVSAFDFAKLTITTNPSTVAGIGDPRWTLNGAPSAVEANEIEKEVSKVEYFDLTGRKVDANTSGVVIERVVYSDGSVAAKKTIR